MFRYTTPEECGIKSADIAKFIRSLEDERLATHAVIIARGDNIVFEKYWKPFDENFLHRMYSVSKSIVSIAVGFLLQDGKISLDDPIEKYFADKMGPTTHELTRKQTIRDMMMMTSAQLHKNWFETRSDDRVRVYFDEESQPAIKGGTIFRYDSSGTFVIGALVERLTGMPFMDYLRIKLFDKIGVSPEAHCLKCPGGHSWGDSAVLCTARDLLKIARFTLNYGEWEGEQILSSDYLKEATSVLIPNDYSNDNNPDGQGYGYYIWHSYHDSFSFNGLGNQYAICVPKEDLILIINSDNQGMGKSSQYHIFNSFFEHIVETAQDGNAEVVAEDVKDLEDLTSDLKLIASFGDRYSETADAVNGKKYICGYNPMGWKNLRFDFGKDGGCLYYENKQGQKELRFGMCENAFGEFGQDGYSDEIGSQPGNRRYKCAASASWISKTMLYIKVQIIDTYFGTLDMIFSFADNTVSIEMDKTAEDFLNEYCGRAYGIAE